MSYSNYKKKSDKLAINMVLTMLVGFIASAMGIWAIVEFILYLVKDNPFNWTSVVLTVVGIIASIIMFFKTALSD